VEAIRAVTKHVVESMNRGDLEAFFGVVCEDAVFFPPNEPAKRDEELRQFMAEFLDQNTVHFDHYVDEEIEVVGELAVNHYFYRWTVAPKTGGEPQTAEGHGIRILKQQAGSTWKITYEMWSCYRPRE
jgi:ketosteroid isomerase-like protein